MDNTRRLSSIQLDSFATSHLSSPKETIKEFNLDRQQLAFTLAQKTIIDGIPTNVAFASTTVFSDEVIELSGRRSGPNNASTNPTVTRSRAPKPPICELYKYGPRQGYPEKHDEIYIIYNNPLRPNKYGGQLIIFLSIEFSSFLFEQMWKFRSNIIHLSFSGHNQYSIWL